MKLYLAQNNNNKYLINETLTILYNKELLNLILGKGSDDSEAREIYIENIVKSGYASHYIKVCKSLQTFEDYYKAIPDVEEPTELKTKIPTHQASKRTRSKSGTRTRLKSGTRTPVVPQVKDDQKGIEGKDLNLYNYGLRDRAPEGQSAQINNPIKSFDKLTRLIAAKKAGHDNTSEDISKICLKLLKNKLITKDQYDKYKSKYFN